MILTVDPLTAHLQQVPPGRRRAALVTAPRRPFAGFLFAFVLSILLGFGAPSVIAQNITVSVSPNSTEVSTGASQQFTAQVTGTGEGIVIWSLSGPGCVGITCGSITGGGTYTAPKTAPNPPTVSVTAMSLADTNATGSATVQILAPAPITVTVAPTPVTVSPGMQQVFAAAVTGTSKTGVFWTVTGPGCFLTSCGSIDGTGIYTAPAAIPNPPTVSVTAISNADFSKQGSAQVTLAASVGVTVVPTSVQLLIGNHQQFTAQLVGTSNTAVNWAVSGTGCSGSACGTVTNNGLYTAPATPPNPATVLVAATAAADSTKTGGASVTVVSTISVTVLPAAVHVNPNSQLAFNAVVAGTTNQAVTWSLSGAGCSGTACGQITSAGVYTGPAVIPFPNIVAVKATSTVDPSKSGTATVYVGSSSPVHVTTSPASANVPVNQMQQFSATVTGSANTAVNWSVSGIGCAGPSCGTVDSTGLYTAPAIAPAPSTVNVTAQAQADPTRSASSIVTVGSNIKVTISPTAVQLAPSQNTQFTASVTGSNNKNVTWSMSSPNCAGNACGTLTQSGLYAAPSTISGTLQITIKVTPQADTTKNATAAVTVALPVVVTVKPQRAQVVINGQQQFVATISNATAPTFNWTLSGAACPNSCGSITSDGLYTAPAQVTNAPVTVKATSQSNANNFGTAAVQITGSADTRLSGQYAFLFQGTDSSGLYQAAGSFVADGKGAISSGVEDINRTTGAVTGLAFTGTYTVGADNRGVMGLTSSQGTRSYAFTLTQSNALARFIETDVSGIRGTGTIKLQNPKAFNNGSVLGGYTVSLTGANHRGARIGALADLYPDGAGFIAGPSMDVNEGGDTMPTFTRFSGAFNVNPNGRGTASLSVPGFDSGSFHFVIYVISASEFFLLSTDQLSFENPLLNGDAQLQTGSPFANNSFSGSSVFYETGWTGSASDVSVGRFTYDGKGNVAMQFDENDGGAVSIANLMLGTYSVAPSGRTTLNLTNLQTHQPSPAIMYAISQNTAFIMDASPFVHAGYLETQTAVPPFRNSDMVGSFTFASSETVGATNPFVSGSLLFDGNGGVQGNEDADLASGRKLNELAGGTYSVSPASNDGRAIIMLKLPASQTLSTWLATFTRAYSIPTDANETMPSVLIFEQ